MHCLSLIIKIHYSFFLKTSLLEYNCFTMVCQFLLYNKVNQLYIYIYPHISSLLCLPIILCNSQKWLSVRLVIYSSTMWIFLLFVFLNKQGQEFNIKQLLLIKLMHWTHSNKKLFCETLFFCEFCSQVYEKSFYVSGDWILKLFLGTLGKEHAQLFLH